MSLRRTPGVICQCQGGTPVDGGTLSLTTGGLPGPTIESMAALSAARDVYASVLNQMPVCMSWDSVRQAGELARSGAVEASFVGLTMAEAVYGFAVREVAMQYLGVREVGVNRGPEVDEFQKSVGLKLTEGKDGNYWCATFVYHCHVEAAEILCAGTSCPRTAASCQMIFQGREKGNLTFKLSSVMDGTVTPIAGDVFVLVTGGKTSRLDAGMPTDFVSGHTGIVINYDRASQALVTLEGNTNMKGEREGIGVFLRTDRLQDKQLWGFMRPRIVWN